QWWEGGHFPPLTLREAQEAESARKGRIGALSPRHLQQSLKQQLLLILILTLLCLAGYYLVSRFIATSVIVQVRSMVPTLNDGERFILNRLYYFYKGPE